MSLKPLKASDQRKINEKMQKRKKEILDDLPPFIYIISEGVKTEPNYISGLADAINCKYRDLSSGKIVFVKGTGRNTKSLLQYARKQVNRDFPQATVVWLMYDKDDFPLDNFDNTQHSAESRIDQRQYKVVWSNECIELWFVLHYQDLHVNNGREHYQQLLENHCNYDKTLPNLYDLFKDRTQIAIQRAKRQYESYGDLPPSQRCPSTRVFELVEDLQQYL